MIENSSHRCTCVRLKPRLDVVRFSTWPDDAKTNGLVVLELKVNDALDPRLTHCEAVLCFSFFDDSETRGSVVGFEKTVEGQRDFHGPGHPNDFTNLQTLERSFFGCKRKHALHFLSVK